MKNMTWNSCLILLFCLNIAECQVEIHLCENPQKNQRCEIVCTTNDFLQDIEFFLGGNSRGSCTVGLFCTNGITQTGGRNSTLPVSGLSKGDEGEWKCKYNTQESTGKTLIVKSNPSTVDIVQTIPDANVTKDIAQVDMSATCFCIYPSTTEIDALYKTNKMSDFEVLERIPASSFTLIPNPGHSCLAYEFEISLSNYTISIQKNAVLSNEENVYFKVRFGEFSTTEVGPFHFTGSTTTESTTIDLSTDVGTTNMSETSTEMTTESLLPTQSSASSSDNTLSGSTESVGTKSETSTVPVTTSPSGLSEKTIGAVSAVGGILLIVIIVIVVLCCKRRAGIADKKKLQNQKLHIKNGNKKDLNSNYDEAQKNKYSDQSRRKIQGPAYLNKNHPHLQSDILYGNRMSPGAEFTRSQNYYQQNYIPQHHQHHYRKQNNTFYLPSTAPRNMMYYQRYPGSGYNEDMLGYSRGGPYKMQQFYPKSYVRHDSYTDYGLERRIGHARGQYESYWDDTLY